MVKKIVKLTDHSYAYNSLTNFEYEVNVMTGNGYKVFIMTISLSITGERIGLLQHQEGKKNMVKKIVKLTDHTYAYNSLTNFEYV